MKKLSFYITLAMSLMAVSCATIHPRYSERVTVSDFREYTAEGFIISPASSGFEYDPIAEVQIVFYPGLKEGGVSNDNDAFFVPSDKYMLSALVSKARAMGATGILNFKFDIRPTTDLSRGWMKLSGFAVKIK